MPQDINQGIFPELVGVAASNKPHGVAESVQSSHHKCKEAALPTDSLQNHININQLKETSSESDDRSEQPQPNAVVQEADMKGYMGNSSKESTHCYLVNSCQEADSCTSGHYSDQEDLSTTMQYETTWDSQFDSQTEDLLFHFDRFFRQRFDRELEQYREAMEDMLSEQQIHLKQIMLKSECEEFTTAQETSSESDDRSEQPPPNAVVQEADMKGYMGNSSKESTHCYLVNCGQEADSCTSGHYSDQEDLSTTMQYETTWDSPFDSQTEDLLFQFDRFFRQRFETDFTEYREAMEDILSEQQIHLKQIMLQSECDEFTTAQMDEKGVSEDILTAVTDDAVDVSVERACGNGEDSTAANHPKSMFLIRLFTGTCRLVTRLQSTAFHL